MPEIKQIDYLLRSTWLAITKMYNEKASKYDSSMVVGFTLLSIDPKEGTPSTLLGPKMGIEATSLSRTLKKLEERKLIIRTPNPLDKRGVIIELTELGKEMRDVSKQIVFQFNKQIENQISTDEYNIFKNVLEKIHTLTTNNLIQNSYE